MDIEIKAGHDWTNYKDGGEPAMQMAAPHSCVLITRKLPVGNYTGHLRVVYANALQDWKLTVNEWGQRVGVRPIFSYEQESFTTPEFSCVY